MSALLEPRTERPAPAGRTTIPAAVAGEGAEVRERRDLRRMTFDEQFNLIGAAVAALCASTLLFGWLTPLTGVIGWLVVSYLLFVGLYVLLTALRSDWQDVADRVMTVLLVSAGVILFAALVYIIVFPILGFHFGQTPVSGLDALVHPNFYWQTMQLAAPSDSLDQGGVLHAIVGTLIQIGIALAITIPLGLTTAVFLNEVGGRFARFVRTVTEAMTALPSIVAGLFVYAAFVQLVTLQRDGLAAAMAITVMMLPIMIRAADVVLRLVPGNLREASYALGSTQWRTVWNVVLPTSRSGLVTAVILATARGIGETSPVLLTSGVTSVMNANPVDGPMISLPLQVFDMVRSSEPNQIARGLGTAVVLLALVLLLFIGARIFGGRGPGQLSPRQQERALRASQRDLTRMSRGRPDEAAVHRGVAGGVAAARPPKGWRPPKDWQAPKQAKGRR